MNRFFHQDRGVWTRRWREVKGVALEGWVWSEKTRSWAASHPNLAFTPLGLSGIVIFLKTEQYAPAATFAGAWFALTRHFSQTEADRRRRISEAFSKAVTQLASDNIEERLGAIYTLESISKESPGDYWAVMETLSAFVRERSRRYEVERTAQDFEQRVAGRAYLLWQEAGRQDGRAEEFWARAVNLEKYGEPPTADIAAVLTVIKRRDKRSRDREIANEWFFDLSKAYLRGADLRRVHLEHANLAGAHFEGANLWQAHLDKAYLVAACFQNAHLTDTHLENADLAGAHLEGTVLRGTRLDGTRLASAHLEGADFRRALGLTDEGNSLSLSNGDAKTQLPAGLTRPEGWPVAQVDAGPTPPSPEAV